MKAIDYYNYRKNISVVTTPNGEWKDNALTLSSAKEYIDYGEDDNYL